MSTQEKMPKKFSRRIFLHVGLLGTGGAILAACAPNVVETEVVATEAVVAATQPPTAEPVATDAVVVVTQPPAAEPVVLKWMVWGGVERFDATKAMFFKTYPEMESQVELDFISPGAQDLQVNQALRLSMASDFGIPDIFAANYASIPEFARAGVLLDLADKVAPWEDKLSAGGKSLMQYEGQYVAVPNQPKPKIWFYRKDLFDNAGIDPSQVKTFEDYITAGEAFRAANPDNYFMNIGAQPIHYWWMQFFSHWDDFRIANEDGAYNIISDERVGQVYDWLKQMYKSDISFKEDDFGPDWQPAFADEKICGWLCGSWGINSVIQMAPEQAGQWKLALWPEFSRTGSEAGGGVYAIPAGGAHPEEAWDVLAKMNLQTEGAVAKWRNSNGLFPVTLEATEQVKQIIASGERPEGMDDAAWKRYAPNYFGPEFVDTYFEALDNLKVPPFDPSFQAELAVMRNHTEAYFADQETLEEALAGTQADMESQIGNPYDV